MKNDEKVWFLLLHLGANMKRFQTYDMILLMFSN